MKLNLKNLNFNITEGLKDLGNNYNIKLLKPQELRKLLKTIKIIDKEFKDFEDVKNKLVEAYGVRDENGNLVHVTQGVIKIEDKHSIEVTEKIRDGQDNEFEVPMGSITFDDYTKRGFKMTNVALMHTLYDVFIVDAEEKKEE